MSLIGRIDKMYCLVKCSKEWHNIFEINSCVCVCVCVCVFYLFLLTFWFLAIPSPRPIPPLPQERDVV